MIRTTMIAAILPALWCLTTSVPATAGNPGVPSLSPQVSLDPGAMDGPGGQRSYPCGYLFYYDDTAMTVQVFSQPDEFGYSASQYCARFTAPDIGYVLRAAYILVLEYWTSGDPAMRVYLYDDDGFGFPGAKLDSIDVPYTETGNTWNWYIADFSAAGWYFADEEDFHVGWVVLTDSPDDTLWCAGDWGTGPHNYQNRSTLFVDDGTGWMWFNDYVPGGCDLLYELGPVPCSDTAELVSVPKDYPTIQQAIDAVCGDATVVLEDGVYTGPLNGDLNFFGKSIHLRSETGPEATVIDGQFDSGGEALGLYLQCDEGPQTTIEGITFRNCKSGAAIRGADPIFANCRFINNGGIEGYLGSGVDLRESSARFNNCLFSDNLALLGSAVFVHNDLSDTLVFDSCLIVGNESYWGRCIYGDNANFVLSNCSMVGNLDCGLWLMGEHSVELHNCLIAYGGGPPVVATKAYLSCCNLFGNEFGDWVGSIADQLGVRGNICADPMLCDTAGGDYRIHVESPCAPVNNECEELIGALGIGCGFICGDMNGDGQGPNIVDVSYLVAYLFGGGEPPPVIEAADINGGDGLVNIIDLTHLVNHLFGGGAEPDCG